MSIIQCMPLAKIQLSHSTESILAWEGKWLCVWRHSNILELWPWACILIRTHEYIAAAAARSGEGYVAALAHACRARPCATASSV